MTIKSWASLDVSILRIATSIRQHLAQIPGWVFSATNQLVLLSAYQSFF